MSLTCVECSYCPWVPEISWCCAILLELQWILQTKNSSLSILDCILFCWFPPLHFLCSLYLRTPIILDFGFSYLLPLFYLNFSCFPSIFFFLHFLRHFPNLIFHHSLSFSKNSFCFFIVFIVLFKKLIILFLLPVWYFYSPIF